MFIFYSSGREAPLKANLLKPVVDWKDASSQGLLHLKFNNKSLAVSDVNMEQLLRHRTGSDTAELSQPCNITDSHIHQLFLYSY